MNESESKFKSVVLSTIKREGILDLMAWLDGTDFYTAPASTRFHGARERGLVDHSLAVYRRLVQLVSCYGTDIGTAPTPESLAIVALFHDICKVNCYKVSSRNVKDDRTGLWHKEPFYKFEEDFCYGGHGSKSVYLVQNFLRLSPDEAVAINCHMGPWDRSPNDYSLGPAYEKCPLAWILHVADEAAAYIDQT